MLGGLGVAVLGALGNASAAAPAASSDPGAAKTAPTETCTAVGRGAIVDAACDVARALGRLEGPVLVAAGAPAADRAVNRPAELSTRVARTLAAALGSKRPALAGSISLGEARAKTPAATTLVFVSIDISGGRLRLTADADAGKGSFWDRIRFGSPAPRAHAFSEQRLDGEVGSFLPPVPLVSSRVDKATAPNDIVALACGDLDGDGSLDLVVVDRRRIASGRIRAGHFVSTGDAPWTTLSPVAPSPLREPIASAVIAPGRYVDVGLTDRTTGVRLGPTLELLGSLSETVPWFGVGCLSRTGIALGSPRPCAPSDPSSALGTGAIDVDSVAGTRVVSADGSPRTVVAFRERSSGTAFLADDRGRSTRVPGVGGQIALGDVDLDGSPELAFGADTENPAGDALTVRSWTSDGALRDRFRLPVPDGIRALAICPPDDARAAPIVVATGRGIWVVR